MSRNNVLLCSTHFLHALTSQSDIVVTEDELNYLRILGRVCRGRGIDQKNSFHKSINSSLPATTPITIRCTAIIAFSNCFSVLQAIVSGFRASPDDSFDSVLGAGLRIGDILVSVNGFHVLGKFKEVRKRAATTFCIPFKEKKKTVNKQRRFCGNLQRRQHKMEWGGESGSQEHFEGWRLTARSCIYVKAYSGYSKTASVMTVLAHRYEIHA